MSATVAAPPMTAAARTATTTSAPLVHGMRLPGSAERDHLSVARQHASNGASPSSAAVLRPSLRRETFSLLTRALCACRAWPMLRRAASFCRSVGGHALLSTGCGLLPMTSGRNLHGLSLRSRLLGEDLPGFRSVTGP